MEQNNFSTGFTAMVNAAEAIKKISNVPGWWGVSFSGSAVQQDDTFVITMGGDSFFNCTVTEFVPGRRVTWLVTDCNMPWYTDKKEWAGTRMIFDINEQGDRSHITFTHEGLTPGVECYADCAPGWTHWIKTSLASYLTTGKGVFRQPTK